MKAFMTDVFRKSLEEWVHRNEEDGYEFHKLLDESIYNSCRIVDEKLERTCTKSKQNLLKLLETQIGLQVMDENPSDKSDERKRIYTLTTTSVNEVRRTHATSDNASVSIEFPVKFVTCGITASHTERQETTIVNRSDVSLSDRHEKIWRVKPWRKEIRIPLLTRRVYDCTLQDVKVHIPENKMLQIKVKKSIRVALPFSWIKNLKRRKKKTVSTSDLFTYHRVTPDITRVSGCVTCTVWDIEMRLNHSELLPRE